MSSLDVWNKVAHLLLCLESQEEKDFPGYGVEHNWKKESIFWLLPYWKTQLLGHNIDVMHTERNVFMNVFNIVMDINGKSKDTHNARMDLEEICNWKELELVDVTHYFHSLMFIEKYVNVFVCLSLISLDFVLCFILPRSAKG